MISFNNVSKIYSKPDKSSFYALKHFTFNFDKKGMYCILGKSGSGKSTIANLAALLDNPSEGKITYNDKDISKYKVKEVSAYHSKIVTTVFQHYNLLNDLTVLENIIMPRLALQEDAKNARKDALILLKDLGFEEIFSEKLAKDLSGGEAQRVAILRAIINNPEVIIADEPTGALDEENSILIMEMLKKISLKKTVIVITHNSQLALEYGDEILHIKDGELEKVEVRHKRNVNALINVPLEKKLGKHKKWMYEFAIKRFKKNKGKNILSCISTIVGLVSVFLIIGFTYGSKNVINSKCFERFDYTTAEISKTETIKLDESILNLTKLTRLEENEINNLSYQYPFIDFGLNFDKLFANSLLKINGHDIKGISIGFVYKYDDEYCDRSLLYKGSLPPNNGIIINQNAEEEIIKQLGYPSLLGRDITISSFYRINNKVHATSFDDEFNFNKSFKISGCSKEFSFLGVPKIYLSYSYIKEILLMDIIPKLSHYSQQEITWYDYINNASNTDEITSFSHKLFSKRKNIVKFESLIKKYELNDDIDIDCDGYLLKTTFTSLMDSVSTGLGVFSLLAMIGTILIIGINAFSSYAFEKKNSAIYFAFGVTKSQIFNIFILESILVTFFAYLLSVIFSFGLEKLINLIVFKNFDIANLISIPFKTFNNVPFLLLIAALVFALTVCIVFTYIPLSFSKKINLKKELSDE